jgi:hypothetical protein
VSEVEWDVERALDGKVLVLARPLDHSDPAGDEPDSAFAGIALFLKRVRPAGILRAVTLLASAAVLSRFKPSSGASVSSS